MQRPLDDDERPELLELIERHERGELHPCQVALGDMPPGAGPLMRSAAEDIRLLMGLRLAVDEDRPLPYATSFAAKRLGLGDDKRRASRVIKRLISAGVVEDAGRLPRRPGGFADGTRLLAPPDQRCSITVEVAPAIPAVQPARELVDEPVVHSAQALAR